MLRREDKRQSDIRHKREAGASRVDKWRAVTADTTAVSAREESRMRVVESVPMTTRLRMSGGYQATRKPIDLRLLYRFFIFFVASGFAVFPGCAYVHTVLCPCFSSRPWYVDYLPILVSPSLFFVHSFLSVLNSSSLACFRGALLPLGSLVVTSCLASMV